MAALECKEEGNRFFKEGQWAKAIEQYTRGLQSGQKEELPADVRGLLLSNRSQCRLNLNEWQEALEDADACLKLLPSHTKSLFRRATAYDKLEKKSEALADYMKVAKVEPKNTIAVERARSLREDVMSATQKQRDEVLPAHLLDVLRKGDGTLDAKKDACNKLRALCVHKSLGRACLHAGVLEVAVKIAHNEETDNELRASAMGLLSVMASGHEAKEEDDDGCKIPMPPPSSDKPLEVADSVTEVRRRLKEQLQVENLRHLCHPSPAAMRHLALICGHTYVPEDVSALEILNDALLFVEGADVDVPRAALIALCTMSDTRRRLGRLGKPLMPSVTLLKCLESSLSCTSCQDVLKNLLASVFSLFADKDRSKKDEIDLAEVGLKILEPFLQTDDVALKSNGLAGLATLFAASSEAASTLLHSSPVPLTALLNTLSRPQLGADGRIAQSHAAECLLLTTGNVKTRQHFIEGGGIDMMLKALCDDEDAREGLLRAKLIGVLSMLAAHNREVREEVFDRLDFLLELRHALDAARESAASAKNGGSGAPSVEEARRLARGLYESCACLTIHGEFKELLQGAKKTLKAMHDLVTAADLTEDPNLSFLYTSIMYNLCRSRDDKQRPKKDQFPFNELGEDDLQALEEFYEKLPAESRPVKNGEVDSGSVELAVELRDWCVLQSGAAASVVSHLAKCTTSGSARVCNLAALTVQFLCKKTENRRHVVTSGGVRLLLGLVDLEDEVSRDAARQALAQICISTNPTLFSYREQLDTVRPLVAMLENNKELLQFESAMGLTNLLTLGEAVQTRALQADAWRCCRDLLFSENEMVQRAGIEAMCNFTMCQDILEKFAEGKAELEIKIFCAFCLADDKATQMAASGALAMISAYEEIAHHVASNEKFGCLLQLLEETKDPELQHRVATCLCNISGMKDVSSDVCQKIKAALREKQASGFASRDAAKLVRSALEEGGVSGGA